MTRTLLPFAAAFVAAASTALAAGRTVTVTDAWARATPNGATTAAAYLVIRNGAAAPDTLLGGETPAARVVQVHEMSMSNGVMHMAEVKNPAIAAHGELKLQPGGWHLMLIGLKTPLKAGGAVPLTLHFAKAGTVKLVLPVKDAPTAGMAMH